MSVKLLEDAKLKADVATEQGTRTLDFYAAAFSATPDKAGDIIDPHAFDGWLLVFYAAGKSLPISFSHAAVIDGTDPMNFVGYAPADPQHVWVDDYGLRVKGYLDMADEKARKVASLIDNGVVNSASFAFSVGTEKELKDGSRKILAISSVIEAGPCLMSINPEAVVLALKAAPTVNDARALLLLPPVEDGDEPLAEFDNLDHEPPKAEDEAELKHNAAPAHLQTAHDALVRAGAKCATVEAEAKTELSPQEQQIARLEELKDEAAPVLYGESLAQTRITAEDVQARLRRLRFIRRSIDT